MANDDMRRFADDLAYELLLRGRDDDWDPADEARLAELILAALRGYGEPMSDALIGRLGRDLWQAIEDAKRRL